MTPRRTSAKPAATAKVSSPSVSNRSSRLTAAPIKASPTAIIATATPIARRLKLRCLRDTAVRSPGWEPVHKLIPVRSARPSSSEARACRLTSATNGGSDGHNADSDDDGRNTDNVDSTRIRGMTADSTDSMRTDGMDNNRIRSTGNACRC